MTRSDWFYFGKLIIAAFVYFYLNVWFLESSRAGSWKQGHALLWKKPKKWQVITLVVLWSLIIIAFIAAISIQSAN